MHLHTVTSLTWSYSMGWSIDVFSIIGVYVRRILVMIEIFEYPVGYWTWRFGDLWKVYRNGIRAMYRLHVCNGISLSCDHRVISSVRMIRWCLAISVLVSVLITISESRRTPPSWNVSTIPYSTFCHSLTPYNSLRQVVSRTKWISYLSSKIDFPCGDSHFQNPKLTRRIAKSDHHFICVLVRL